MPDAGKGISYTSTAGAAAERSEARQGRLDGLAQRFFVPQRTAGPMRLRWLGWVLFLFSLSAVSVWPEAMSINRRWYG
jgi:hypothetical protein